MLTTLHGQKLTAPEVVYEVLKEVQKHGIENIEIWIGTDSQNHENKYTRFVTAFVIYRDGKGGRVFLNKRKEALYPNIKQRMIQEAYLSIEAAKRFTDAIVEYEIEELYDLPLPAIHADVNGKEMHKSNTAMKEIVGFIKGMGFDCVIKPGSVVASTVADKFTK